ncbi:MAG TPA: nucleotidyltransferase [Bacillota bacterium]|nr:nucleotidyltransferase [Bacillota bacterium]
MNACGLVVEYNPFHNGHVYHIRQAKKKSQADCIIAVMSGSFLQRGEPAIVDKFHRTKAALASGIDLVLELPYPFSVQSSQWFATGAVQTLHEIGVKTICFGSESGSVTDFLTSYHLLTEKRSLYKDSLKYFLTKGLSFPEANQYAYYKIGLTDDTLDLSQPNNILGLSYVQAIIENNYQIEPLTIKRLKNNYHDSIITDSIASATSIRKQLLRSHNIGDVIDTLPSAMAEQLQTYKSQTNTWHTWDQYFDILHHRVMTMDVNELRTIHGVDEGIEYRIKKTAKQATSFRDWMKLIKTKRYTWNRIQRMFVHLLTNTKKAEIARIHKAKTVPYVRLLGMTKTGQAYLNQHKKQLNVPLVSSLSRTMDPMMAMEERSTYAYYSICPREVRSTLYQQELQLPIIMPDGKRNNSVP